MQHAGPGFGRLLSPRQFSRAQDTSEAGIPWAADNDCFQRLDEGAYRAMLQAIYGLNGCKFVVAPDVVGDWKATAHLYDKWQEELSAAWLPIAYVAQDGQPSKQVPWGGIDSLFIGGTTEYKLSADAERLGREARERGKWLHMGRVNSRKRFDYARSTGCNSIDGSSFSRWRDRWLPNALTWRLDHLQERIPA
jgi:hypothetical protein